MLSKIKNFLTEFKELYLNRKMLVIGAIGYGSGIPFTLVFITYTFRLAESGINLRDIGLFGLAGLPFTIKFVWSPLVDGMRIPILYKLVGQRRSWLVLSQIFLIGIICKFGFLNPQTDLRTIVYYAIALAFVSATYDIAYDAIRVEMLEADRQGAGAGMAIMGYRIGMLMSGGISLIVADVYSWKTAFFFIGTTLLISTIATLFAKEPTKHIVEQDGKTHWLEWCKTFMVKPFLSFIQQHKNWVVVILFAVLYKLGDAMLGKMANPFYQQMGFTKTEVAEITKFYGFGMTIIGSIIGGWAVYKFGLMKTLLYFGILQMLSNLTFVWQAHMGHNTLALTAVITIENIASAMGTAAFTAYLSSLCNVRFTATQYALLTSFMSLGRWLTNAPSGYMVDKVNGLGLSWETYFTVSTLLAIPGLLLIRYLNCPDIKKIKVMQSAES